MEANKISIIFLIVLYLNFACASNNLKRKVIQREKKDLNCESLCGINASCTKSGDCQCKEGFTNVLSVDRKCTYELKSQKVALMLEIFLFFGVGHFYCYRFIYGMLKLSFFSFLLMYNMISQQTIIEKDKEKKRGTSIIMVFLSAWLVLWVVFDITMFRMNMFRDGNDIPLKQ